MSVSAIAQIANVSSTKSMPRANPLTSAESR
jgi:hypothetical protein